MVGAAAMANVAPPPNPSLIAIILVIQARSGPRLVYHHPPFPLSSLVAERRGNRHPSHDDSSSSDQELTSSSDEDLQSSEYGKAGPAKYMRLSRTDEEDEGSPVSGTDGPKHGGGRAPWEQLLGLDASALERLLMPSDRSWHKRKFEVGFNDLVFVGWPVFIRENGTWRKKRRGDKKANERSKGMADHGEAEQAPHADHDAAGEAQPARETEAGPSTTAMADLLAEETRGPDLKAFNVVFVLSPPILEYGLRVKEMHDHVVKKLGRALKWEQSRANYVWQQSEIILKIKTQARHKRTAFPTSRSPPASF